MSQNVAKFGQFYRHLSKWSNTRNSKVIFFVVISLDDFSLKIDDKFSLNQIAFLYSLYHNFVYEMKPEIFQCPNIWRVGYNNIRITARKKTWSRSGMLLFCALLLTDREEGWRQKTRQRSSRLYLGGKMCSISFRAAVSPRSIWKKRFKIQKSFF